MTESEATNTLTTMTTEEEYLQKFEDRMLDSLLDNYKSLKKNLVFLYTLLLILLVFNFKLTDEAEILGMKFTQDEAQRSILMPVLIMIPYLLINHAVLNIARLIKVLKSNSDQLLLVNRQVFSI